LNKQADAARARVNRAWLAQMDAEKALKKYKEAQR
jgi:hypothetical protein